MRFDGYFLLMDAWDAPNLHPRSFAMARWRLREMLFGLNAPPPEALAPWKRRAFVVFAFAVWAYRLVLFVTIAVVVYHFFFKALGVLLFAVELGWFVARPLWREVWGMGSHAQRHPGRETVRHRGCGIGPAGRAGRRSPDNRHQGPRGLESRRRRRSLPAVSGTACRNGRTARRLRPGG